MKGSTANLPSTYTSPCYPGVAADSPDSVIVRFSRQSAPAEWSVGTPYTVHGTRYIRALPDCKMSARSLVVFWCFCLAQSDALPPPLDITQLETTGPQCRQSFDSLRQGVASGQLWAQAIVDAGVRYPVGILSETAVQFGDFDECLGLNAPFDTQFCMLDVAPVEGNYFSWSNVKWGVCVPASCQPQDLQTSIQKHMDMDSLPSQGDKVQVVVLNDTCTTRDTISSSISIGEVAFCVMAGVVILALGIFTIQDIMVMPKYDGVSHPKTVAQCLSVRHGWYSLLRVDQAPSGINLGPLYSLHLLGVFFVIVGHRFGIHMTFMTLTNYKDVRDVFSNSWVSLWAGHMDLFVDLFFFMSAFLLAVLYSQALDKHYINPLKIYFNRLCRLVPAYLVVLFFYSTILRHTGTGPLWNFFMIPEQNNCRHYWWTNILFINNYIEKDHICLPQSWYISCDFQLFLVGALLVCLLHRNHKTGLFVIVILTVVSTVVTFLGTYLYDRPALMLFDKAFWTDPRHNDMFSSVYTQGHYRGTSYLPGLLAGYYIHRRKIKSISKTTTYVMQGAGLFIWMLVHWSGSLFYDQSMQYSRLISSLYAALFHTAFGLAMSLLTISWTIGHRTPMTSLLSWQGFIPLGKLSYCVYLIHFIFPFIWIASSRTPVYLNIIELVSWSIADLALSLVASFVLTLTIEIPVRYLVKHFTTSDTSTTAPTPKQRHTLEI